MVNRIILKLGLIVLFVFLCVPLVYGSSDIGQVSPGSSLGGIPWIPTISGSIIVWQDLINPQPPAPNGNIYLYDLSSSGNVGQGGSLTATHIQTTQNIKQTIEGLKLPIFIKSRLRSELNAVTNSLSKGNTRNAKNLLRLFVNDMKSMKGKMVGADQANALIQEATQVNAAI